MFGSNCSSFSVRVLVRSTKREEAEHWISIGLEASVAALVVCATATRTRHSLLVSFITRKTRVIVFGSMGALGYTGGGRNKMYSGTWGGSGGTCSNQSLLAPFGLPNGVRYDDKQLLINLAPCRLTRVIPCGREIRGEVERVAVTDTIRAHKPHE